MSAAYTPPHLDRADLADALKRLIDGERHRYLFAFHGTGDAAELPIESADATLARAGGVVRVVPVESELGLRRELPKIEDPVRPMAFLVPFTGQLPLDLQGRFAHQGKIRTIGNEARLRRLLGVSEVDPDVSRSPLAPVVLRSGLARSLPEARLRLPRLWGLWLEHTFKLGLDGDWLTPDRLLGWAATSDRGPDFTALPEADALRSELLKLVEPDRRKLAEWIWRAWERRLGREMLGLAIVSKAAGTPSPWLRLRARTLLQQNDVDDASLTGLAAVAESALRRFERPTPSSAEDRPRRRQFLRWADALVDDPQIRRELASSELLPLGFDARLATLGDALVELGRAPSVPALRSVLAAREELGKHEQLQDVDNDDLDKRIQMAVRLAFWLVSERSEDLGRADGHAEPAGKLGSWYVKVGGYIDWARRVARGGTSTPLDRGIDAVVAEVDRRRRDLDRRFAKALVAWVDGNRRTDLAIPIDRAAGDVIVPFLERWKDERLLVLLMDGMAWPQAVEILESLREEASAWMPVTDQRLFGEPPMPVFANLPTLTEISRSAFFAGKPMESHRSHATRDDPERFAAARALGAVTDARFPPKLLLRADGQTRGGAASTEALTAIGDVRHRVVGIVVNVIDDALSGNPGHRIDWRVGSFASLRSLLEAARDAGRTVLFVGDHGHVTGDRLEYRAPPGAVGGARWRPYREGEVLREDEVLLRSKDDRVWCPRGADGVVLLADDETRYTSAANAGEHGGASLSEVVTPCVLIRWHDPFHEASGLRVAPLSAPPFWHDETLPREDRATPPHATPATPTHAGTGRRKPQVPASQLVLLPEAQPSAAAAPVAPAASSGPNADLASRDPLASALGESEIFRVRLRDANSRKDALAVVSFLAARGGRAPKRAIAAHLGRPERTIVGYLAHMQTALNLDQYPVLDVDHQTGEVLLDPARLVELFELPSTLHARGAR